MAAAGTGREEEDQQTPQTRAQVTTEQCSRCRRLGVLCLQHVVDKFFPEWPGVIFVVAARADEAQRPFPFAVAWVPTSSRRGPAIFSSSLASALGAETAGGRSDLVFEPPGFRHSFGSHAACAAFEEAAHRRAARAP